MSLPGCLRRDRYVRICPHCHAKTEATVCDADGTHTVDFGQYLASQNDRFVGQVFEDRYRIDSVLGKGGFGAVYRGEQLAVGRPVAIKLLHVHHAEDAKEIARFQREARAIAALRHPNIVQVHDFGRTRDGFLYLVMEFLEGRTLQAIIREEAPMDPDSVIDYLVQALDGLAEAHSHGIIHRDLKPENLFCASIGRRNEVIKLLDFGIAKIIDDAERLATLTGKGMTVGSPYYMAPEQARAQAVSPQTDLYLIGLIAYELLSGKRPFKEASPMASMLAHIRHKPAPLDVDGQIMRGPLADLVMQCLEKEAARRPPSAEALMKGLEACRGLGLSFEMTTELERSALAPPSIEGTLKGPQSDDLLTPPGQFRMPSPDQLSALSKSRREKANKGAFLERPLAPTIEDHPAVSTGLKQGKRLRVFLSVFLIVLGLGGGALLAWDVLRGEGPSKALERDREMPCTLSADCGEGYLCIDGDCQPE